MPRAGSVYTFGMSTSNGIPRDSATIIAPTPKNDATTRSGRAASIAAAVSAA
jgi:hypothetical protein